MESGSSYRVYRSSDLYSIPPTAMTKRSHTADDGVGWSGFAFLIAVGIAIGGASFAAMNVVKPDMPRHTVAVTAPPPAASPMPLPVVDPTPAPGRVVGASPITAPPAKADVKADAKVTTSKPKTAPRHHTAKSARTEAVPPSPYEATKIDRGLPPAI